MKTAWRNATVVLVGAVLALTAGVWMILTARAQARFPREIQAAREALLSAGGEQSLQSGLRTLAKFRHSFELEQAARDSDAAVFSQRVEEVLAELGLSITTSSDWQPVPELAREETVAFERTFVGSGALAALLDAVHSIERWPDRAAVRALAVTPEAEGSVAFSVKIALVRNKRSSEPEES